MEDIRVFEVNDCEWWAGNCTPEELLAAYMEETGCTHEESTGDEEDLPRALTDEEMDSLKFRTEDGEASSSRTFREHLAQLVSEGQAFPCFFATTEF